MEEKTKQFHKQFSKWGIEHKVCSDFHIRIGNLNIYPTTNTCYDDVNGKKFKLPKNILESHECFNEFVHDINLSTEFFKTGPKEHEGITIATIESILQESHNIIFVRNEEKDRKYGPFIESMSKAARVASELCNKEITTEDFYKCMIALKISRMAYNHKHDTMLDALGYIAGLDDYLKHMQKQINDIDETFKNK